MYGAYASLLIGACMTLFKFFPILLYVVGPVLVVFTVYFIIQQKIPALIATLAIGAWSYGVHFLLKSWLGSITALETAIVAYVAAFSAYMIISLITPNPHFNLNKMLNREPKDKPEEQAA